MEVRAFATAVLRSESLCAKLAPPPSPVTDHDPGPPWPQGRPARPWALRIQSSRACRVPPIEGMRDPAQRVRILHALANHELQAAELFAWALLAFPAAVAPFRRGLLAILGDEQRHCRLYIDRLHALGADFGDYPLTGHFWNQVDAMTGPLGFVCIMGLTFENANLDFAPAYAAAARAAGDRETCRVLETVHADEIRHVRFAWRWLNKLKNETTSPWQTYLDHTAWPLGPARARGSAFDRASRARAGLDEPFIAALARTAPKRPGGAPR